MKTSDIIIIFILGTMTLLVFVVFMVLIVIEYRKRQVRHIAEKLELEHEYKNQVLQTQIEVQEQSLRYFSEEVHDNIAQMLALTKLKLYRIAGKATDESMRTDIEATSELLGKTLNDLRTLSHVLNGNLVAKIPLTESIEKELDYVRATAEVATKLTITGSPYELNAERKLMAFRIVQEAISNAIRHGTAREIDIALAYQPDALFFTIRDNGTGFETRLVQESKGLGLHNMQVRARMLGDINFVSAPDAGTTVTLKIKN